MTAAEPGRAAPIARPLTGQAVVTGANCGRAVGIAPEVVRAIGQPGVAASAHLADVSGQTQVLDMLSAMAQLLARIDILTDNAGLQRDAPFQGMTLAPWNGVISVSFTGQFRCTRGIGEPDDICKAALWLACEADSVVGATLFGDGGVTLFPGLSAGG
jgi:glucose 1-dehydrogenase